ncbi:MAG: GGDEF domain-containing protein [Nocardiopsaceae bacterium]|nr:GGDEF domain-containing protein [Nocardiopsaceae bacterium]
MIRLYLAIPPAVAAVAIAVMAWHTSWRFDDLPKFLLLLFCGMVSVVSTPRTMHSDWGLTRDFSSIWVLPAAILLPPVYAAIMPIPILVTMKVFARHRTWHRTVYAIAATSLGYTVAAYAFRSVPASLAGAYVGPGPRAFTWALAVAACEIIGGMAHRLLVLAAVRISDRGTRRWTMKYDREALQRIFVEIDLGVLTTLAVALSPALVLLAVPTVLLARRFLVHPLLVAQSRVDAKTGLLNAPTWESEAGAEISRAVRSGSALALALVDIDHFKAVNDTHGHLAGDRALKAVADALAGQLREDDRAGRFGGEEFVLLLSRATETEARRVAERLRLHICELAIPVSDSPGAARVRLTISAGVTAMEAGRPRKLTDMLAAADSALYEAKRAGRNRVSIAPPGSATGLRVSFRGGPAEPVPETVRIDPAGASLGPVLL